MSEWLAALPFDGITVVGVALLVSLMVWRGLLIPRSTYQDVVTERDYWRKAAEDWRASSEANSRLAQKLADQNTLLLPTAELSARSWEVIRMEAERGEKT